MWAVEVVAIPTAVGESAEVLQFFSRITDPGETRKGYYRTLINGLVSDGLWAKLDALYMFAADTQANGLVNLKSSSFSPAVANGSPTFTADQGFTGDGASAFIDTVSAPTTGIYSQNSASFGCYIRNNSTDSGSDDAMGWFDGSIAFDDFLPLLGGNLIARINGDTSFSDVNANRQGSYVITTTADSDQKVYKNSSASAVASGTNTNLNIDAAPAFYVLARNDTGTASNHSPDQIASAFFGSGLTGAQAASLMTRINAYMTSLGTNVY